MWLAGANAYAQLDPKQTAIDRSLKLLSSEVPGWISENHCASCHNQGDAAIAIIEGSRLDDSSKDSLQSTLDWLAEPSKWSSNRGLPEASDQQLANLQFAGALLAAYRIDRERFQAPIDEAAEILAADQSQEGAWKIVSGGEIASPITHGEILLSGTALRVMQASNFTNKNTHIDRAMKWLERQEPRNTLEAASLVIALPVNSVKKDRCISMIVDAQDEESGGWGPHRNVAPEVFDTALAVLALNLAELKTTQISKAIDRGIEFFVREQNEDGSWQETTRPSGTVSYAHRISTTAWATRALLAESKPTSK